MKKMLILIAILTVLLVACPKTEQPSPQTTETTPTAPTTGTQTQQTTGFQGRLLAGSTTPYYEFNKADYELALRTKPYVVLYFYANWCPICKAEQPHTFAAFNELDRSDMVGFRVNYRDSETDQDEEDLAKEFGVSYQHTKVVLKDGQRILKAPDSWDKERYLAELGGLQ